MKGSLNLQRLFFLFVNTTDSIIERKCSNYAMEEIFMKEIYVYKQLIGGWIGLSKEEADAKIEKGSVAGVQLEMERGEDEPIKITLLKDHF